MLKNAPGMTSYCPLNIMLLHLLPLPCVWTTVSPSTHMFCLLPAYIQQSSQAVEYASSLRCGEETIGSNNCTWLRQYHLLSGMPAWLSQHKFPQFPSLACCLWLSCCQTTLCHTGSNQPSDNDSHIHLFILSEIHKSYIHTGDLQTCRCRK